MPCHLILGAISNLNYSAGLLLKLVCNLSFLPVLLLQVLSILSKWGGGGAGVFPFFCPIMHSVIVVFGWFITRKLSDRSRLNSSRHLFMFVWFDCLDLLVTVYVDLSTYIV